MLPCHRQHATPANRPFSGSLSPPPMFYDPRVVYETNGRVLYNIVMIRLLKNRRA